MKATFPILLLTLLILSIIIIIATNIPNYSFGMDIPGSPVRNGVFSAPIFQPWGADNHLSIKSSINGTSGSILKLDGTSGKGTTGFVTEDLNYRGSHIRMVLGNIVKDPQDAQISFSIDVKGLAKNYTIVLISGRNFFDGWRGDTYYKSLSSRTAYDINLSDLLASHNGLYLMTKKINLVIQKGTIMKGMDFRMSLCQISDVLLKLGPHLN